MRHRRLLAVALLVLAGCRDAGGLPEAGTLTATLESPYGDEGAAVLVLVGSGVVGVGPAGDTETYSASTLGATHVVLMNRSGGALSFEVELADVRVPPVAVVSQVAGPDDELREDLSGYRVELSQ